MITKMLQLSVPPGYRRRERPASKKLGPYMAWIDKVLEDDRTQSLPMAFLTRPSEDIESA
jgi:hypothetical protein